MPLDPNTRAQRLHNLDDQPQRRAIPTGSGAIACWGAEWSRIIELLANPLGDALPEIKHKQTIWIIQATGVGAGAAYFDSRPAADEPGRRPILDGSGAQACWGGGWANVIDLLGDSIVTACPEVHHRTAHMIMRARPNGLRIEFMPDEASFKRRSVDAVADLVEGRQVHCGGRNGLMIEFFDDDDAFRKRLVQLEPLNRGSVQIHAGRLSWM